MFLKNLSNPYFSNHDSLNPKHHDQMLGCPKAAGKQTDGWSERAMGDRDESVEKTCKFEPRSINRSLAQSLARSLGVETRSSALFWHIRCRGMENRRGIPLPSLGPGRKGSICDPITRSQAMSKTQTNHELQFVSRQRPCPPMPQGTKHEIGGEWEGWLSQGVSR